jgi:Flp pilus assembly pilin Flp
MAFPAESGDACLVVTQTRVSSTTRMKEVNAVSTHLRARSEPVLAREEGQTMAEYAVVLSMIAIVTVAVFIALSGSVANAITSVIGIV